MAPPTLRYGLLGLASVACLLLIVAEFTDLYSIRVITVTVEHGKTGPHHGYALGLIAVAALVLAVGATVRGSRPAAVGMVALGAVALLVALLVDLPVVDDTGVYGRDYERATAQSEIGFKLETAGAILLLLAGVATLQFGGSRSSSAAAERQPRASTAGR